MRCVYHAFCIHIEAAGQGPNITEMYAADFTSRFVSYAAGRDRGRLVSYAIAVKHAYKRQTASLMRSDGREVSLSRA